MAALSTAKDCALCVTSKKPMTQKGSRCTSTDGCLKERGRGNAVDCEDELELDYEDASDEVSKALGLGIEDGVQCEEARMESGRLGIWLRKSKIDQAGEESGSH
ncbi:hypothetical protein NDU88_003072 [Pleurodeles waltl]|uniref:Uncharacterized protein n=1 Tax=Pleurodeles waltl TaxID=8319 RepID=A0AAV7PDM9_PLEWA|nr:hypothetical protein NDU88_003072 [Pleurodeles waltl]